MHTNLPVCILQICLNWGFAIFVCKTGLELKVSFSNLWENGGYYLALWLLVALQMAKYSMMYLVEFVGAGLKYVFEYSNMKISIYRELGHMKYYTARCFAYGFIFTSCSPFVVWGCYDRDENCVLLHFAMVYFSLDLMVFILIVIFVE